ncbi:hypothetical protein LX64_04195 [Chitinophaga skermanii]|uniref:Uncharacterized protein n=1 Tax=Chitinophaga skermanii TaxID=331697 RepID=A0A327Q7K9_9BACT|nr:hypothetical protein [Chitinophaga skermanii]RAJ00489.1 hypothetical protein LX64_04195 [Chitinophaga skermanii]
MTAIEDFLTRISANECAKVLATSINNMILANMGADPKILANDVNLLVELMNVLHESEKEHSTKKGG